MIGFTLGGCKVHVLVAYSILNYSVSVDTVPLMHFRAVKKKRAGKRENKKMARVLYGKF